MKPGNSVAAVVACDSQLGLALTMNECGYFNGKDVRPDGVIARLP